MATLGRRRRGRSPQAVRLPPQRVGKDSNAAPGRANVFDFTGRNPVVDRAPTNADHLARLHDANRLALHRVVCLQAEVSDPPALRLGHSMQSHELLRVGFEPPIL